MYGKQFLTFAAPSPESIDMESHTNKIFIGLETSIVEIPLKVSCNQAHEVVMHPWSETCSCLDSFVSHDS